jgi:hypothetical protein
LVHFLFETARIRIRIKQSDPDPYQIGKQDPVPYQKGPDLQHCVKRRTKKRATTAREAQ